MAGRGRPPIPVSQRKRHVVAISTTMALRERILEAAQNNQRSMTQEIEHRLIDSFEREDILVTIRREFETQRRLLTRI